MIFQIFVVKPDKAQQVSYESPFQVTLIKLYSQLYAFKISNYALQQANSAISIIGL